MEVYQVWKQTYPREFVPYANLGLLYINLGKYENSLEETREALHLEPNVVVAIANLAYNYECLDRLDQAQAVIKQAEERKVESALLLGIHYLLAFLQNDSSEMGRVLSAAESKPGIEDLLLSTAADTEAWHGRLARARELTREAAESAGRNNAKEAAANYLAAAGLREAEAGNREQARANANAAMKLAVDAIFRRWQLWDWRGQVKPRERNHSRRSSTKTSRRTHLRSATGCRLSGRRWNCNVAAQRRRMNCCGQQVPTSWLRPCR